MAMKGTARFATAKTKGLHTSMRSEGMSYSLSIPEFSSPSPHSYCPGVDTLSRRSCWENRRGGGIPMTTAAARIVLAVRWLGFGSAPIPAVNFGMEFTTFCSTRR
jgi:hypothetical protein